MTEDQAQEGALENDQAHRKPESYPKSVSHAHVFWLNACASMTQGVATTNFSSDIIKQLYMWIYKITFEYADIKIYSLLNWLSVAILIGSMIAAFTLELTRRFVGYNRAAIIGAIGCTVFNALQCVPVSPYYTLVMRLFSGYFYTTYTMMTISIVGQLAHKDKRGPLGIYFYLFVCVGMLIAGFVLWIIRAAMIEKGVNIFYVTFLVTLVFSTAGGLCYIKIPKITQEQNDYDSDQPKVQPLKFGNIFSRMYMKLLFVTMLLGLLYQLTGINSVIVYATETFKTTFVGSYYSSVYGSLIIAAVNIVGTVAALPLINRMGRRWLLYSGTVLCIIGTVMIIVNYTLKSEIPALLITASVIFIFGFELGPGSVFFVYAMELFPDNGRGIFTSILQVFNFAPNFLVILLFTYLTNAGKYVPFVTYLVGMLICGGVLVFLAPETRSKTRYEIDEIMGVAYANDLEQNEAVVYVERPLE